jgi:hypothetical protein
MWWRSAIRFRKHGGWLRSYTDCGQPSARSSVSNCHSTTRGGYRCYSYCCDADFTADRNFYIEPTPTYTPTPLPLTYPTIAYGFETLKGEGWTKFEQIVISATVEWTGTVTHMPMFSTEVSVDVGQDNAWRDVSLEFKDKQQREQLKTGDSIRFRAMVRQVNVVWWSRRFEVRLADVELLYIRHKAVDD